MFYRNFEQMDQTMTRLDKSYAYGSARFSLICFLGLNNLAWSKTFQTIVLGLFWPVLWPLSQEHG